MQSVTQLFTNCYCLSRRHVLLVFLSLLVFSASCSSSCNGTAVPGRKQIIPSPKASDSPEASRTTPVTTNDLVVYLDISEPMKGYVHHDQSVFNRTLRTLREFSTTLSPPVKVHLRKVSAGVGELQSDIEINRAAHSKAIYTGDQSNLVGAIGYFNQNLIPASGKDQVSITPPRFHILVTDGVQYSSQASADGSCSSGSDAFCMRKKILDLLNQGWAGAVIGIRSQFGQTFFSEQAKRYVDFTTDGRPVEEHRPFYLFVFSPDHAALDNFVITLKEALRRDVNEKDLLLRELPLTGNYSEGAINFDPASGFQTPDKAKLRVSKIPGDSPNDPLLISLRLKEVSAATEAPFTLNLSIPWSSHGKDCGGTQELASVLDWQLEQTYPAKEETGKRYPEIDRKIVVEYGGNDQLKLSAVARWPKAAGTPGWRGYRLAARLKPNSELNWIRAWSTDNDRISEAGTRTLDLKTTLLGLWRNPVLEKQPIAEFYLRIGPQ